MSHVNVTTPAEGLQTAFNSSYMFSAKNKLLFRRMNSMMSGSHLFMCFRPITRHDCFRSAKYLTTDAT